MRSGRVVLAMRGGGGDGDEEGVEAVEEEEGVEVGEEEAAAEHGIDVAPVNTDAAPAVITRKTS